MSWADFLNVILGIGSFSAALLVVPALYKKLFGEELFKKEESPVLDRVEALDLEGKILVIYSDEIGPSQVMGLRKNLAKLKNKPVGVVVFPSEAIADASEIREVIAKLTKKAEELEKNAGAQS